MMRPTVFDAASHKNSGNNIQAHDLRVRRFSFLKKSHSAGELDGGEENGGAEDGSDSSPNGRMGVVAFRQQFAGADVKEKAAEQCQDDTENFFRWLKKQTSQNTGGWREGVGGEPAPGPARRAAAFQDERDGIDTVGKIVSQNRHRHHQTNSAGDLKSETDGQAVQKAMED